MPERSSLVQALAEELERYAAADPGDRDDLGALAERLDAIFAFALAWSTSPVASATLPGAVVSWLDYGD